MARKKKYEQLFLKAFVEFDKSRDKPKEGPGDEESSDETEWRSFTDIQNTTGLNEVTLANYRKWALRQMLIEYNSDKRKYRLTHTGSTYLQKGIITSQVEQMASAAIGPETLNQVWDAIMTAESHEPTFLPHVTLISQQGRYKIASEQDVYGAVFVDSKNKSILRKPYIENFIFLELGFHADELIHQLRDDIVIEKIMYPRDFSGLLSPQELKVYYAATGAFFIHFRKNHDALRIIDKVMKKDSFFEMIARQQWKLERLLIHKGLRVETLRKKFKSLSQEDFTLMINYFILSRILMIGMKSGKIFVGRRPDPLVLKQQMLSLSSIKEILEKQHDAET